jgi:radical SAM protein with 4Fe4S-binding SPASM domain
MSSLLSSVDPALQATPTAPTASLILRDFRERLVALSDDPNFAATATDYWRGRAKLLAELAKEQPLENFLSWTNDVDHEDARFYDPWYDALRASPEWSSRWERLSRRAAWGLSHVYSRDEGTSPVVFQHAYNVMRYEAAAGERFLDGVEVVVEVGGGYGNFARMLREDGFAGPHVILDLPHIREFQRAFLQLCGVKVTTDVELVDGVTLLIEKDIPALLDAVKGKRVAFVATWSLSETPLELRAKLFPALHASCVRYLIASQWPVHRIDEGTAFEVDNEKYFTSFIADASCKFSIEKLDEWAERYLFGFSQRDANEVQANGVLTSSVQAPIPMFRMLEIETRSTCNRRCAACIRNSHPDREAVRSWFEENELSLDTIYRVLSQVREMGCTIVALQHYNEPLEDKRLATIAAMARSIGFESIWAATNADLMTPARAAELDGKFDQLDVALYPTSEHPYKRLRDPKIVGPERQHAREAWLRMLFHKTRLNIVLTPHVASHFSPIHPVAELTARYASHPCHEPTSRMIVNHRGDMLMCCQDVIGHFELGSVHETAVDKLWYSEKHQSFVRTLSKSGGRSVHPHCLSCPQFVQR